MSEVVCFGEVLWDLLPRGQFLGGAPFNVAYHLTRLGQQVRIVSTVGSDSLGRDAIEASRRYGLKTDGIGIHPLLPTGTVTVKVDREGQPSYRISEPVAWDAIAGAPPGAARPRALVYGSLALRLPANREALRSWIGTSPMLRVCDLNLRAPYDDWTRVEAFVRGADLLKLNGDEAARILAADGVRAGPAEGASHLARRFDCRIVCVTLGSEGAVMWDGRRRHAARAPAVVVRDTIGAGDAFMAAFLDGVLRDPAAPDWQRILERSCLLGAWVASKDGAQPDYRSEDLPALKLSP